MASITIRGIEDGLKRRLRIRAATHGRSMEEEARDILRSALSSDTATGADLVSAIRAIVDPVGGIELEPLPREPVREPPSFE